MMGRDGNKTAGHSIGLGEVIYGDLYQQGQG